MKETKKKYNIGVGRLKTEDGKYVRPQKWVFIRKTDGKIPKRAGRVSFSPVNPKSGGTVYLKVTGTATPLALFATSPDYGKVIQRKGKRKTKKIRVKVQKGKTRTMDSWKYAKTGKTEKLFRATMKSGHTGIFFKDTTKTKTKTINRNGKTYRIKYNPILEANSITPTTMFINSDYEKTFKIVWEKRAYKRYEHYLNLLTKGFWK
jgi:hypothetical protein